MKTPQYIAFDPSRLRIKERNFSWLESFLVVALVFAFTIITLGVL